MPCISDSSQNAIVNLLAIKDKNINACSRGCMLKNGGVCRHAIAFCKKAGKNILHFIATEDTTLYWRLQYLREFKVPTNAEYTHYSQLSFDSELESIRQWKTGAGPASSDRKKSGAELGNMKRKVISEERCGICKAKGHRRDAGLCSEGLLIGMARMGDGALAVQAEGDTTLAIEAEHGEWWDSVEGDSSEESAREDGNSSEESAHEDDHDGTGNWESG